ncbi:CAP domain-containing protein [Neobacillus sp. PS3-34]|uniref:CAP domain-containing protein n=1 Tax=Neobacillus sp. PS3-34 TaxID=3070678 RepID=UPI0027DF372E|nr:CAP domain-containing protein [Neobacillus sp. PS3-34]WML50565.1 CAP domain-containing protein [Neobacillus sp. PS3-34]
MNTTMDSDAYPHTRAILVQMSKYQFIPMGEGFAGVIPPQGIAPNQGFTAQIPRWQTGPTPGQQFGQAPTQQQMPTVKPPSQPQGPAAPAPAPKTPAPAPNKSTTTQGISSFAQQVIDLTNVQRKKNGLPALKADVKLSGVAQKKSVDMEQNHYFSHTSPTYGSPFDMMRDFGVSYNAAGENIAMGQRTPQEVVTAWMNSEGHRKNILSPNFTHIGVGFDKNGYYWSQMFIGK